MSSKVCRQEEEEERKKNNSAAGPSFFFRPRAERLIRLLHFQFTRQKKKEEAKTEIITQLGAD